MALDFGRYKDNDDMKTPMIRIVNFKVKRHSIYVSQRTHSLHILYA